MPSDTEPMAPVSIAAMPRGHLDGPQTQPKKLHPFFAGKPTPTSAADINSSGPAVVLSTTELSAYETPSSTSQDGTKRKRRKTTTTDGEQEEESAKKKGRRKKAPEGATPNRLMSGDSSDSASSGKTDDPTSCTPSDEAIASPTNVLAYRDNINLNPLCLSTEPPKKVLKFNPQTGTIGSPPKKPSRIVVMRYGSDEESKKDMGEKIQNILDGIPRVEDPLPPPRKRGRPRKSDIAPPASTPASTPAATASSQPTPAPTSAATHPFFTGGFPQKAADTKHVEDEPSSPSPESDAKQQPAPRRTISMATPCSPRKVSAAAPCSAKIPQFGVGSLGIRIPGACEPAWPPQGMVHVRDETPSSYVPSTQRQKLSNRKSKRQAVTVRQEEDVLVRLCRRLRLDTLCPPLGSHELPPCHPALRLPQKYCESGKRLRERIRPELRTYRRSRGTTDDEDELSGGIQRANHPMVARLYEELQTSLSAFDRSTCENSTWAQKYAPRTSHEVLQNARECTLLRDWLQTLKVQSVGTGTEGTGARARVGAKAPAKKKRRKNKLDGFVVSSEDEADEMDELPGLDDDWMNGEGPDHSKKTVVKNGQCSGMDGRRLTNAIVVSGPHGCGKTAAVYAVAKELDFEVFEINSSTRRSGKDMMDKIGDMTRNHHVQHRSEEDQGQAAADDVKTSDESAKDLKSSKQGSMMSFFKPSTRDKPKKAKKAAQKAPAPPETVKALVVSKSQKQSLILIEEADILFEEDKQFWTTLISLMTTSKRPFVVTCTNESLIPLRGLSLHGIFRFAPVPVDLAVDVLLLAAANEGHSLRREGIRSLYESRSRDLRASFTELNYWCQIGVGDQRGGFDWFYPRWPRGSDLDENGDVVRVISDGTYLRGLGWYGRDKTASNLTPTQLDEELADETWHGWQIDTADHGRLGTLLSKSLASGGGNPDMMLARYGDLCDAMSEADLCAGGRLGLGLDELLDPSLPDIPEKTRDDYIVGLRLLDTPCVTHQWPLDIELSRSIKCLARHMLHRSMPTRREKAASYAEHQTQGIILAAARSARADAHLERRDLRLAFDAIAISEKAASAPTASGCLEASVFDRTLGLVVLDVAPWVRGIVAFDQRLMQERLQRSGLGGLGGANGSRPGKRMRNTRAAFSALEGGSRGTTRRENYFSGDLNAHLVARTAATGWEGAAIEEARRRDGDALQAGAAQAGLDESDRMDEGD